MENSVGTFVPEDVFRITGRGWVLAGTLAGQVAPGNLLVFASGISLLIKGVEMLNRRQRTDTIGLLVAADFASHQEFTDHGIMGATAQVVAG
ncbi:MAG: hypothetical protein ACRYFX_21285 [Janthinobacterium lividum]